MKEQMHDIRELAAKWMDGTITPEEKDRFEKWYNGFDFSKLELLDHWADQPGQIEQQILFKLQASMREIREEPVRAEEPGRSVTRLHDHQRSRWWVAAASVLLLIGTGAGLFYIRNRAAIANENAAGQRLTGDVAPGHYGAVLTLSNGSRMVLDSAGNGQIATQGSSQVLIQNGAVVYEKEKAGGPPAAHSPAAESPASTPASSLAVLYNTMTTPRGRQIRIILPDGSKVWLNAASAIHYPTAFNGNERVVELSGEAYFEARKQMKGNPLSFPRGGCAFRCWERHLT